MNADETNTDSSAISEATSFHVHLIGVLFLLLGGWFLWGPVLEAVPRAEPVMVAENLISTNPLRERPSLPPTIQSGSYDLRCMECHRLFDGGRTDQRPLTQHLDIQLDHGLNAWCFNCHDREQRDRLLLDNGETVAFSKVPQLCGKCHGPVFRDWEKGMHGRTNGSWDAASGRQIRLVCTECHDPHAPAISAMSLLPGPHTLRLGETSHSKVHEVSGKHNPLLRWSESAGHGEVGSDGEGGGH